MALSPSVRGNWVPCVAQRELAVHASLVGPTRSDDRWKGQFVRTVAWRADCDAAAVFSHGGKDLVLSAARMEKLLFRAPPDLPQIVLVFTVENETCTQALFETIVVVDFVDQMPGYSQESLGCQATQQPHVPSWVVRRCQNGSQSKKVAHYLFKVGAYHPLCAVRPQYQDTILVGDWSVQLSMKWGVTRMDLSSKFSRVRFYPSEGKSQAATITEQLRDKVGDALSKTFSPWAPVDDVTSKHSGSSEWALAQYYESDPDQACAMLLRQIDAREAAELCPDLLDELRQAGASREDQILGILQRTPSLLSLFTLILASVTSDALFDEHGFLDAVLVRINETVTESSLLELLMILVTILEKTNVEEVQAPALCHGGSSGGRSSEKVYPDYDLEPVVHAICTVCLAGLRYALARPGVSYQIDWPSAIQEAFILLARCKSIRLAWAGVSRLYPSVLAVVDPAVAARELKNLLTRCHQRGKVFRPRGDTSLYLSVDFYLDNATHILQGMPSKHSLFRHEILPSSEHWVFLNVLPNIVTLLREAALQHCDDLGCSNGFDVVVESLYLRLATMREAKVPFKLDAGLMTPEWALGQTWPAMEALLQLTCAREVPVHRRVVSLLGFYIYVQDRTVPRPFSTLEEIILSIEPQARELMIKNIVWAMTIFSSTKIRGDVHVGEERFKARELRHEQEQIAIASRVMALVLRMYPVLCPTEPGRSMWHSILGFLLFAARSWTSPKSALWATESLYRVVSEYNLIETKRSERIELDRRHQEGEIAVDLTEQLYKRYECERKSFSEPVPWFTSMLVKGIIKICCAAGVDERVVELSTKCLNAVLESGPSSKLQVEAECKLAVFELSRSLDPDSKATRQLDSWVVRMEDSCKERELGDCMFALRAVGRVLRNEVISKELLFKAIENLVGPTRARVGCPFFAPDLSLVVRRAGAQNEWSSEARLLRKALNLYHEAIELEDESHPAQDGANEYQLVRHRLYVLLFGLQIHVQLVLCNALDDAGKDLVVRDVKEALEYVAHLEAMEPGTVAAPDKYLIYLVAVAVALVEDALGESLWTAWEELAGFPSVGQLVQSGTSAYNLHRSTLRHYLMFEPGRSRWSVSPPSATNTGAQFAHALEEIGGGFETRKGIVQTLGNTWLRNKGFDGTENTGFYVLAAHEIEDGFVAYARGAEGQAEAKGALRIEVSTRNALGMGEHRERSGTGALLLPLAVEKALLIPLSLREACKQSMVLSIASIKSVLEQDIWLPQYDEEEHSKHQRSMLLDIAACEIIDSFSADVHLNVGWATAKKELPEDQELQMLCDALENVAHIALGSLRRLGEERAATASALEAILPAAKPLAEEEKA